MQFTEPDTFDEVEAFLAGDDGGLLRKWTLEGFRRNLPYVVGAAGLGFGESVKQRGNCFKFTIFYPHGRKPTPKAKLRTFIHTLLRRTGWRVRHRSLWYSFCAQRQAVVIWAAPDWRAKD